MADLEQAFAIDLKFKLFYQHPPSLLFKGRIDKSVIALQSLCAGLPHRGDGIITLLLPISAVFLYFFLKLGLIRTAFATMMAAAGPAGTGLHLQLPHHCTMQTWAEEVGMNHFILDSLSSFQ